MAVKSQYNDPGTISSTVVGMIEQHVGLFDKYIIYQTAQYEYTGYVEKLMGGVDVVTVYRSSSNAKWNISYSEEDSFPESVAFPYYCYSNVGYGQVLGMTAQTNTITAVSVMGIFLVLCLKTMFFAWARR